MPDDQYFETIKIDKSNLKHLLKAKAVLCPGQTIEYFDENWYYHKEVFDGMKARIIQHEYDHIEGVLFTDYLSSFKKKLIKNKLLRISKGQVDIDYKIFPSKNMK